MIYLRQKSSEPSSVGRKLSYLLFLLCVFGAYLYFWKSTVSPKKTATAPDNEVVVITNLKFETWSPPSGRETLNAGRFAVVEPNLIQLTEGVEVIDHTASRGFDQWNGEAATAEFQAANSVQVLNGAQILEVLFQGEVTIKKDGAILTSSDVRADLRTDQVSSDKKTNANKRTDSLTSENGFRANLKTGEFQFMGPMSGQMETFP